MASETIDDTTSSSTNNTPITTSSSTNNIPIPTTTTTTVPYQEFLDHIMNKYDNVYKVIIGLHYSALTLEHDTPFDKEDIHELYIRYYGDYFYYKYQLEQYKNRTQVHLAKPPKEYLNGIKYDQFESMAEGLALVMDRILSTLKNKLKITEEKYGENGLPRIVKLARTIKLSEKETLGLIYAVCTYACQDTFKDANWNYGRQAGDYMAPYSSSLCKACDMRVSEYLQLVDSDAPLVQQGIFLDIQTSYSLNSLLTIDEVFLKGILGAPLKTSEFMKLEQTSLAEIISNEEGNEKFKNITELSKAQPVPDLLGNTTKITATTKAKKATTTTTAATTTAVETSTVVERQNSKKTDSDSGDILSDKGSIEDMDMADLPPELRELKDIDEDDLASLLRRERILEEHRKKQGADPDANMDTNIDITVQAASIDFDPDKLTPYTTNLEYLDDSFQLISYMLKAKGLKRRIDQEAIYNESYKDTRTIRQMRETEYKTKIQKRKCEKRLELTRQATNSWTPRLERLTTTRKLCEFEKNLLLTLIGSIIQPDKINNMGEFNPYSANSGFSVGDLLRLFCSNLTEQIKHRTYFYKNAKLVREGMIVVHDVGLTGDPSSARIEIDRRMLDFTVGLDTEFSEVVEGSHLYFPKTKFELVILSGEQKDLILSTVSNFESYKRCRKRLGMDDVITYGAGMVMLFHGPPGTGKTMMANALANKLNKKVLLINFPSLGSMTAGENFKFIFREAKINDAILFFDECEGIFETREKGGHNINLLLTEIERHDGLIILATNRPYDLDEAMHRRITIAIEFSKPDHLLRKEIWASHIPKAMELDVTVDLTDLALRFELTGGFIKNAILSALSISVTRDGDSPIVCQNDLLKGANLQLRGRLRMKDFDRRIIPSVGLNEVVADKDVLESLNEIVQFEKARAVLFGQWGFGKNSNQGLAVLFHGAPGTGKSHTAEAIGFEVGKPLKVVNCGELLSKWVGESTKNIEALFEEAKNMDAILLFDDCDGLFGHRTSVSTSTDRYSNVDVGVLLYHIEKYSGIVILTTNLLENLDKAFYRRFRYIVEFTLPPSHLRSQIWKLLIPKEAPLEKDIDFDSLGALELTGGAIKNSVFRAASKAALRGADKRIITTEDLKRAAIEESEKTNRMSSSAKVIYS